MAIVYDRWTMHIDKITSDFLRDFGSLSSIELNWKPKPDAWSIAQNIDHLILINNAYFPLVQSLRMGEYKPPFLARFKFFVDKCRQYILDTVHCDPIDKIKTFPTCHPPKTEADENIFDKLERHQHDLKQLVSASYELLVKEAVISSPGNRLIVYKLSTAFDVIVAQEKRHFEQATEMLILLKHKMIA